MAHQIDDERGQVLGQLVFVSGVIRHMHLTHARDLRRGFGSSAASLARNQQMHFAKPCRGGHRGERRILHRGVVVFDQNQRFHIRTLSRLLRRYRALSSWQPARPHRRP